MIIKGLDNILHHVYTQHQKNVDAWCERNNLGPYMSHAVKKEYYRRNSDYAWGANVVGDHDEDYVFDALFDVPSR